MTGRHLIQLIARRQLRSPSLHGEKHRGHAAGRDSPLGAKTNWIYFTMRGWLAAMSLGVTVHTHSNPKHTHKSAARGRAAPAHRPRCELDVGLPLSLPLTT